MASPRKQFLQDLKNDPDFQRHRANAQWKEVVTSSFGGRPDGYYTIASGTYGIALVTTSDVRKIPPTFR